MKEHRKLAAIMFTDIVGYTALMSKDEQHAHQIIQKSRNFLKKLIEQFNGEWLQAVGDGTLSSFASVVDAVNCALEIQRSLKSDSDLTLRIGIHIGDVVFEEGEIYGDGVNVASRLEQLAEPGGICISGRVYSEIRNKPDMEAVFLGEKTLKNVDLPMKVYALTVKGLPAAMAKPYPDERPPAAKPMPSGKRAWLYVGAALVLILLIVGGLYLFTLPKEVEAIDSLAVLPLENLSGDPEQEYFADGMTDALIAELSQIRALRVISRTSVMQYKKARKPLPEIARELDVDAVVEGTVMRAGDKVRITAQLIRAVPERHLWAQTFDRPLEDVLALHSEVARAIAHEINIAVTPEEQERLERVRPVDPEAYQAYLRGRYYWNKRTEEGMNKAIEYFEQAIEIDPEYALAYAGLADSYILLPWYSTFPSNDAYLKAKEAALYALEIDNTLAEAHTSLAWLKIDYDWDWVGAEREFKRAIRLNPGYATAHHWYAWYLAYMERHDESIAEINQAQELDPLSLVITRNVGSMFYYARQYDQAIKPLQRTIEMDPNFPHAHLRLGQVYLQKSMYEEALVEFQKEKSPAWIGITYAKMGKKGETQQLLKDILEQSNQEYVSPYDIAIFYFTLGSNNQGFDWLEKAYEERDRWLSFIKIEPLFDCVRLDPRFKALLNKMGLDK